MFSQIAPPPLSPIPLVPLSPTYSICIDTCIIHNISISLIKYNWTYRDTWIVYDEIFCFCFRMSALHQASLMGNLEMMQILLECHADVSIHDNKGNTSTPCWPMTIWWHQHKPPRTLLYFFVPDGDCLWREKNMWFLKR